MTRRRDEREGVTAVTQEFRIVGVYRVPDEMFGDDERPSDDEQWPYMIEIVLPEPFEQVEWSVFTQRNDDLPDSNWQAAKDEQALPWRGGAAFFFHSIQWKAALVTPYGAFPLPEPTEMPDRIKELGIEYLWD